MKRLVVFSHKLFRETPNGYQTDGALTFQLDALAKYFEELLLCVPIVIDYNFKGVGLTATNVRFLPLPNYKNQLDFMLKVPAISRQIKKAFSQADIALALIPSYVGNLGSYLCQHHQFPLFQWVVTDWGSNIRSRRQQTKVTSWLIQLIDTMMKKLTEKPLTFFNGHILYGHDQPHHHTRTSSSIQLKYLYVPSQPPNEHSPYTLLFVGRLAAEKGIPFLLQALAITLKNGLDIHLHIVGQGEEETNLRKITEKLNIGPNVTFHGYIPQGANLRTLYQQSDLFILPALQDQQPKVLMEAMSLGVPVLATEVGGIPSVISHGENGWLVPPRDPESLAKSIQALLSQGELRNSLRKAGIEYVKNHTVEAETAHMMTVVHKYFNFKTP